MIRGWLLLVPVASISVTLTGCGKLPPGEAAARASAGGAALGAGGVADASTQVVLSEGTTPLETELLQIAAVYRSYGRVDDLVRWAPWLCTTPPPSIARESRSSDESTHGRKLYFLFARDRNAYAEHIAQKPAPIGQAIVKEAWTSELCTKPDAPKSVPERFTDDYGTVYGQGSDNGDRYFPYTIRDGKTYRTGASAGLFIMLKKPPETPDTDEGWIYATISPDLKRVTAAGRIESCMKCHADAPHDRLFGLAVE